MVENIVGYKGEPFTVSEMVDHLRRLGFPATGDRLRQYQRAGFFPSISHDKGDHRQYTAWQAREVGRVFALLELGFRRKEIKRCMEAWETMMREGGRLIRQNKSPDDESRRASIEALTERSNNLLRLSNEIRYAWEMEEEIKRRTRVRLQRFQVVSEKGLRPEIMVLKERLEMEIAK